MIFLKFLLNFKSVTFYPISKVYLYYSSKQFKITLVHIFFHILVLSINEESLVKLNIIYMYKPLLLEFQVFDLLTRKLFTF